MKPTDGNDLAAAMLEFETALPGWWWSVESCGLTHHASCGPDRWDDVVSETELKIFDKGFHCDDRKRYELPRPPGGYDRLLKRFGIQY
jgi:hypothetical protein